jgi:hypothetical protein
VQHVILKFVLGVAHAIAGADRRLADFFADEVALLFVVTLLAVLAIAAAGSTVINAIPLD